MTKINHVRKRRSKKKGEHYVDNKKLYEHIKLYKIEYDKVKEHNENNVEQLPLPRLDEYIGLAIVNISRGLASLGKFSGYSYKEEMISDAIENCVKYLHNFNPDKYKNPHAYISMISHNAFIRRINFEKKTLYIKYKNMLNTAALEPLHAGDPNFNKILINLGYSKESEKKIATFIEDFEKKNPSLAKKHGVKPKNKRNLEKLLDKDENSSD